jgi:HSP20 family protein
MSEVAVSKKTPETPAGSRRGELVQPMFPFGRFSGFSPFAMMRDFADEMDRVFRGDGSQIEIQAWAPTMDVQRCNGTLVVSAELPGLKKEDIKVEVTDESLTIEGERKREHKEDHEGYHRWERSCGRFYRSIALPEGAKTDQVKAELKDGVLKVSIPVPEVARKSRQVPVAG